MTRGRKAWAERAAAFYSGGLDRLDGQARRGRRRGAIRQRRAPVLRRPRSVRARLGVRARDRLPHPHRRRHARRLALAPAEPDRSEGAAGGGRRPEAAARPARSRGRRRSGCARRRLSRSWRSGASRLPSHRFCGERGKAPQLEMLGHRGSRLGECAGVGRLACCRHHVTAGGGVRAVVAAFSPFRWLPWARRVLAPLEKAERDLSLLEAVLARLEREHVHRRSAQGVASRDDRRAAFPHRSRSASCGNYSNGTSSRAIRSSCRWRSCGCGTCGSRSSWRRGGAAPGRRSRSGCGRWARPRRCRRSPAMPTRTRRMCSPIVGGGANSTRRRRGRVIRSSRWSGACATT